MCDEKKRMVIKQGSGVATIPVSADHRNGDWISTDIYQGELYLDTDTGLFYTRNGSLIVSNGATTSKELKFIISQTSTNAPTIDLLITNTIGTYSLIRVSTGYYRITSTDNFGNDCFFYAPPLSDGTTITINRIDIDTVEITTRTGGVLTDSLLNNTSFHIEVYG